MSHIIHKELSYLIRGALIDVHNHLGPLLPEECYSDAIVIGLETKGVACQAEKPFVVYYRKRRVGLYYVDVWIEEGKAILELKVAPAIIPLHLAQAISYLKVTDADLAIVVNFGAARLEDKRLPNFIRDKQVNREWEQRSVSANVPYPELTQRLLEVCHRVHVALGPGFLHQVYRRATLVELQYQDIPHRYIKTMPLTYQGCLLRRQPVRLIAVDDKLLLATVAFKQINEVMKQQLKTRLKHLGYSFGLLVSFHNTTLDVTTVRV